LELPIFALSLRDNSPSRIDFGFINSTKTVGEIAWSATPWLSWTIQYSAIRVQGKFWNTTREIKQRELRGIVETLGHEWKMPRSFVDFYYSFVPGAGFDRNRHRWYFPCTLKLPDITVTINGKDIIVAGDNLKFPLVGMPTQCGGCLMAVARETEMSVFGVSFLQHRYIIFGHTEGYMPMVGVA